MLRGDICSQIMHLRARQRRDGRQEIACNAWVLRSSLSTFEGTCSAMADDSTADAAPVYDEPVEEAEGGEGGDDAGGDEGGEGGEGDGEEDPDAQLAAEIEALNKMINDSAATNEELAAAHKDAVSEAVLKQKGANAAAMSERDAKSIYIGNVDFSTTADELRKFFETCGAIEKATILLDKFTGKPKGYVPLHDWGA